MTEANTEGVKPVQVTQADRECAVRIMADRWHAKHRAAVLAGEHDNWIPVQECAHHRLTHQPDTSAQPVAWLYTHGDGDRVAVPLAERDEGLKTRGWTETPLYAQPASQPVGDVERLRAGAFQLLIDLQSALDLCGEYGEKTTVKEFIETTPAYRDVSKFIHANQHADDPDPQPQADVVERRKIVAWLRKIGAPDPFMGGIGEARPLITATAIADAIEQGKHGEMG